MDEITIQDEFLMWKDSIVYTFQNDTRIPANKILIDKSDCGNVLTFPEAEPSSIIGIAICRESFNQIIDEQIPIGYINNKYYYEREGYLLKNKFVQSSTVNPCLRPIAHLVDANQTYSWSTPSECVISLYYDNYKPYVRFECIAYASHQFFLDISASYHIALQRYPIPRPIMLLNKYSGRSHVKRALLAGATPKEIPNKPDKVIEITREIQKELRKQSVESVVIGSLACRLHGIITDIADIDLMIEDPTQFTHASQILSNYADEITSTNKNKTFLLSEIIIDLSYDNFQVLPGSSFKTQRYDISYLSLEGLWILYTTNLMHTKFEEQTISYRQRIEDSLFSVGSAMQQHEFTISVASSNWTELGERCYDLCKIMEGAEQEYSDLKINEPFQINSFCADDITYCPIINNGSPQKAQVILNKSIKYVRMHSLIGDDFSEPQVQNNKSFSVIETNIIHDGALLICQ